MKKHYLVLVLTLFLCGCGTGYHSQSKSMLNYGYDQTKITEDTYLVSYNSSNWADKKKNMSHAIHRSAELTKEKNYKYFVVLSIANTKNDSIALQIKPRRTLCGAGHGTMLLIRMLNEKISSAYSAEEVLNNSNDK